MHEVKVHLRWLLPQFILLLFFLCRLLLVVFFAEGREERVVAEGREDQNNFNTVTSTGTMLHQTASKSPSKEDRHIQNQMIRPKMASISNRIRLHPHEVGSWSPVLFKARDKDSPPIVTQSSSPSYSLAHHTVQAGCVYSNHQNL